MSPSLADILLGEGLISRSAAADLGGDQRGGTARRPIEVAVRDLGLDEVTLVAAIRRQRRVPLADPATVVVDPDAVRSLSREMCRRLKVLPLALGGWADEVPKLDLAMADPTDEGALAEVEEASGYRVEPALMTLSAIEELVESAYKAFVTEVMRRDPRQGAGVSSAPASGVLREEEAPLAIRHRALLELMLEKELIRRDEYEAAVARLLSESRGSS